MWGIVSRRERDFGCPALGPEGITVGAPGLGDLRFAICDLRIRQMGSSIHLTLPIADVGYCVTSGERFWLPCVGPEGITVGAPGLGELRFAICDLRIRQMGSSIHLTLPIADVGYCVTPGA
jgi:hypothetical protein